MLCGNVFYGSNYRLLFVTSCAFSWPFNVWDINWCRGLIGNSCVPPRAIRITLTIESPLRYFDAAPMVRARAGEREIAASAIADSGEWSFEVPADALQASGGAIAIETDKTFIPAERGSAPDRRRLGLRVFAIHVANRLTSAETSR